MDKAWELAKKYKKAAESSGSWTDYIKVSMCCDDF